MNIGIIAGGGQFPVLFAKSARKKGYNPVAAAYINEADSELALHVHDIVWLHIGQLSRLLKFFKTHEVTEAVMLGSIKKTNIFKDVKPDLTALKFIALQKKNHDDHILSSFAKFLETHGIIIRPSTFLLPDIVCQKGTWTRSRPDKSVMNDIADGWHITKTNGKLDIGQSIVMGNGAVLAVEGADGTDETIRRGGRLAKGNGALLIKLAKPGQDLRFDLPSVGLQTVKTMHDSNVNCLVVEAGKTICFDRQEMIEFADRHRISILAMDQDDFMP